METQKKRRGDRRDGRLLRELDSLHFITGIIYPNRCDNEAYISVKVDLTAMNAYLAKKNETETDFPYTMFHLVVAALLKTITLRPKLNRFIVNSNFYQRNEVSAAFVVKKQFSDRGAEALAVLHSRDQEPEAPAPSRPIAVGDLVELAGVKTAATVLNVNGDGSMLLQAGKMKMTVKAGQVRLLESAEEIEKRKKQAAAAQRKNVSPQIQLAARAASELDIRGMETLEAESVVENYLDAASRSKLGTVTIIHGKGTGALRKAVHEMLKRNKAVKSFRLGRYGEGEAGVTVVELK